MKPANPRSRPTKQQPGRTRLGAHMAWVAATVALLSGCAAPAAYQRTAPAPSVAGEVTLISPRCVGARSCVLGHVTAAESGAPLSQVAVFLQPMSAATEPTKERAEAEGSSPGMILALTDDQGVFTVVDPPPGDYRIAVYARSRKAEVRGLKIETQGTTMVPIRLTPGAI